MRNFVGLGRLSFRTSVSLIPGFSHTGIRGFAPDGPATTTVGCGSRGIVKNDPRDPLAQRMPINLQPVGPEVSSSVRCPRWGLLGRQGPCLGIISAPPLSLAGDIGLMVAGMPRLSVFIGCRKRVCRSPHSPRESALTQQSTLPDSPATLFRPPPVLSRSW